MKNLSSLLVLFVIANCLIFNAIFAQDSEFSELDAEFAS